MPKKFLVLALATFSLILVACSSTDDTQLPSPVEVTREVEVTRLVPVEVTRDIPKEVPVAVTRQMSPAKYQSNLLARSRLHVRSKSPAKYQSNLLARSRLHVRSKSPAKYQSNLFAKSRLRVRSKSSAKYRSNLFARSTRQIEVIREVEVIHEVPVTVVHQPTEPPVPEVQSYSGVGDDVLSCRLSSGNNVFEFTHSGHGHFAVWVHDDEGDRDLLVNEVGKYEGVNFVRTGSSYGDLAPGPCILEITADGSWTAEIRTNP